MFVYWIRHKTHLNILNDGYIGITCRSPQKRFEEHKINTNDHLKNALKKYKEDIVFDIILQADKELCLLIEEKLRPEKNIGWNIEKGGNNPPDTKGRKLNLSDEERIKRSERTKGSNNPMYGKRVKDGTLSPRSKESIEASKKGQDELVKRGIHIFQSEKNKKIVSKTQRKLVQEGKHHMQSEKSKQETGKRTSARNKITNSIVYVCPHCGKNGKGPNMKRYHFDNCKKLN